ncbi:MAG TPA: hypothetical protein VME86_14370 [Acidobacteriaceae bacterium]|nr:hypothetical protein [Acidobacteriaceae bacterium]
MRDAKEGWHNKKRQAEYRYGVTTKEHGFVRILCRKTNVEAGLKGRIW